MATGLAGDIKIGLSMNTKSAEQSLSSFRKKINSGFGDTNIKALDKSIKQTEKTINQLETSIKKTKQKLTELTTNDTKPKSVITMEKELSQLEKQLIKANTEFEKLTKEQADLAGKQVPGLTLEQSLSSEQITRFEELDSLIIKNGQNTDKLNSRISELKTRLSEIQQNPQLSDEGKKYNKELDETTNELNKQKQIYSELKNEQIAYNTRAKTLNTIFNPFTKVLNKIKGMIKRVFIFSVLTAGLRSLRTGLTNIISQNTALSNSLNQIRSNLLVAFAPIVQTIVPWLQILLDTLVKVTAGIAQFMSALFGKSLSDSKAYAKGLNQQATATKKVGKASKDAAKETEKATLAFDELNQLEAPKNVSTDNDSNSSTTPTFNPSDIELGDEMQSKLKDILSLVGLIGAAFAAWKIADFLKNLQSVQAIIDALHGKDISIGVAFAISGLGLFLDGWQKIKTAIDEITKDGPNFDNVTLLLEGLAEGIGGAMLIFGKIELGSAWLVISAVVGLIKDIRDISKDGPNWDNITSMIDHLALLAAGIAGLAGYTGVASAFLVVKGIIDVIKILHDNWDKIKEGDWSGVNKTQLIAAVLTALGGLAGVIIAVVKNLKKVPKTDANTTQPLEQSVDNLNTSTGNMSSKLKSLIKNLAGALVVMLEVAAAITILLATIWLVGTLLVEIGKAWQPVIDNGSTIAEAMGIGTGLLIAVGLACYLLGQATIASGGTIAGAIAIGAAMLLEIGVALAIFLGEIYAIGWGLEQIGIQWQPVLDNGETISKGIEKGSELLLAVGAACAVLGALTIASVGLLPLAISLGTKMLTKLGNGFKTFTKQITSLANQIKNKLHPSLKDVIDILPDTEDYLDDFMDYMKDLLDQIVTFTTDTKNFKKKTDKLIKNFKDDPIKKLADDVEKQKNQTDTLNDKLELANPELETCIDLITTYYGFLQKIEDLTSENSNIDLKEGMFTDMKKVGKNLILGFVDGMKEEYTTLDTEITTVFNKFTNYMDNDFKTNWKSSWDGIITAFKQKLGEMQTPMQSFLNHIIDGLNSVIKKANLAGTDISKITGKNYSKINTFSHITIPPLARGAVLPPNQPFLAVVGDQKRGTNIEAPLSTIQEALSNELDKRQNLNNYSGNITLQLKLDERVFGQVVIKAADLEKARKGNSFVKTNISFA